MRRFYKTKTNWPNYVVLKRNAIVLLVSIKLYLSFCIQSQVSNLVELPFKRICFRSVSDTRSAVIEIFLTFQIIKREKHARQELLCPKKGQIWLGCKTDFKFDRFGGFFSLNYINKFFLRKWRIVTGNYHTINCTFYFSLTFPIKTVFIYYNVCRPNFIFLCRRPYEDAQLGEKC